MVEYEGAKVDTGLPIFNYAVGYNLNNCELLMYEKYPRSINDVSQLRLDETLKGIQKLTESLQIEKEKLDVKKKIAIGHFEKFIEFSLELTKEITDDIERRDGIKHESDRHH